MEKWILKIISLVTVIIIIAWSNTIYSDSKTSDYIRIEVNSISYLDKDNYQIEIELINDSDRSYYIQSFNSNFYTQTEILGQWKLLDVIVSKGITKDNHSYLSAKERKKIVLVVHIPLTIPRLYRNFEGDVNVMFKYNLDFSIDNNTEGMNNSGDSSYWITPKTDTWVLREGM